MKTILISMLATGLAIVISAQSSATIYNIIDLGTLGGISSSAYGISDNGKVTGDAYTAGNSSIDAFMWDGTMHDVGSLYDHAGSEGRGVNNSGQVTGFASTVSPDHAYLYDGTIHDLGSPGDYDSLGMGINNSGHIAGYYDFPISYPEHGFLWDGTFHDIGVLDPAHDYNTFALAINDLDQITGSSSVATGSHAFVYDGIMHDIGTLGGAYATGHSISNNGLVAGQSDTLLGAQHAFFYNGTMHDLGTLGGSTSNGEGVNTLGQVVGYSGLATGGQHAFIYDPGVGMMDLNSHISPLSGWILTDAVGINSNGWIAGTGIVNGTGHAFVLVPTPEPSTWAMAVMAGACAWACQLRAARKTGR